jgi:hypothetical protein
MFCTKREISRQRAEQALAVFIGSTGSCPWSWTSSEAQLDSVGLSVRQRKHITSPLRAQQVNAIYRFVTMLYHCNCHNFGHYPETETCSLLSPPA